MDFKNTRLFEEKIILFTLKLVLLPLEELKYQFRVLVFIVKLLPKEQIEIVLKQLLINVPVYQYIMIECLSNKYFFSLHLT